MEGQTAHGSSVPAQYRAIEGGGGGDGHRHFPRRHVMQPPHSPSLDHIADVFVVGFGCDSCTILAFSRQRRCFLHKFPIRWTHDWIKHYHHRHYRISHHHHHHHCHHQLGAELEHRTGLTVTPIGGSMGQGLPWRPEEGAWDRAYRDVQRREHGTGLTVTSRGGSMGQGFP